MHSENFVGLQILAWRVPFGLTHCVLNLGSTRYHTNLTPFMCLQWFANLLSQWVCIYQLSCQCLYAGHRELLFCNLSLGLWSVVQSYQKVSKGTQLSMLAEETWERVCSLNLAAPCRWRMQYIVQTYLRMEKLRCNTFSSISGCTSGVKRVNLLRWPHEALPSKDHPHGVFSLLDCCTSCGLRKRLQWFCEKIAGKMINSR